MAITGQRFLADIERIQAGVRLLVEANKNRSEEDIGQTFRMTVGKTGLDMQVSLNKQLCLMLK